MTDDVDSQLLISGIAERGCSRARKDRLLREAKRATFTTTLGNYHAADATRCEMAYGGAISLFESQ